MLMKLWKFTKLSPVNPADEALERYLRLTHHGDPMIFLDTDSIQLIDDRDTIEEAIKVGRFSESQKKQIIEADKEFKNRCSLSMAHYKILIAQGDKRSVYLQGVLDDLADYGKDEPKGKWWFHLLK
jgi:hypothetical protein